MTNVLLMTNGKLYMGFRLAPRSMTLDDLELDGGDPVSRGDTSTLPELSPR